MKKLIKRLIIVIQWDVQLVRLGASELRKFWKYLAISTGILLVLIFVIGFFLNTPSQSHKTNYDNSCSNSKLKEDMLKGFNIDITSYLDSFTKCSTNIVTDEKVDNDSEFLGYTSDAKT